MKTPALICSISGFLALSCAAQESLVKPTLESVGLFKNGLAVVRATFPVSGPGTFRWDKVPRAVHGSFWIESDGEITIQSTQHMVDVTDDIEMPTGLMQRDLAGNDVTVMLKTPTSTAGGSFSGKVWNIPATSRNKTWDLDYSSLNPQSYPWYFPAIVDPLTPSATRHGQFPRSPRCLRNPPLHRPILDFLHRGQGSLRPGHPQERTSGVDLLREKSPLQRRSGARKLADQRTGMNAGLSGGPHRHREAPHPPKCRDSQ